MALPFIAGLIAGVAAVSALRSERGRTVIHETGSRLKNVVDEAGNSVRSATDVGRKFLSGAGRKTDQPDVPTAEALVEQAAKPATPRKRATPAAKTVVEAEAKPNPKPKRRSTPRKAASEKAEA